MKYDIITVGSAVIDAFLETDVKEKGNDICFPGGSKIAIEKLFFSTGGGGTNTAVAFSKLGFKTGFLGKLGNDEHGDIVLRELKKDKVDFLGKRGKEATGYSVIIDGAKRNRAILTHKGANDDFKFSDLQMGKLNTGWFYFSSMIGNSLTMQSKLADWAFLRGIKIAYNVSSYLTKNADSRVKNILRKTDVLVLNDSEAKDLVPHGNLFEGLHKLGPRIVCVTYGMEGNKVSDGKNICFAKPHNIKVVERTGAGDAFASGFVAAVIKYSDVKRAIEYGTTNAESVIQSIGAKNGLLREKEILQVLRKRPVRILA